MVLQLPDAMPQTYFKTLSLLILLVLCQAGADAQSFRVLVVASRAHDHLKMIAAARPFFEKMAAANDFAMDFTDDTSVINTANLAHYQVFVMLHLAPFDMSASQQAALQQFVEEGKGWVGIHAAGLPGKQFLGKDSHYWQWFEDFLGGITYSPHPAYQHATLVVEDRSHPATRHLPARMDIPDEWYEFDAFPDNPVHYYLLPSMNLPITRTNPWAITPLYGRTNAIAA